MLTLVIYVLWQLVMFVNYLQSDTTNEPIRVKTVLIENSNFIVSNSWGEIPVSENEDLNARDGWAWSWDRPIISEPTMSGKTEKRKTLASEKMDLFFDLKLKNTAAKWVLRDIQLSIDEVFELNTVDYEQGKWVSGNRLSSCRPEFELTEVSSTINYIWACPSLHLSADQCHERVRIQVKRNKESPVRNKAVKYHVDFTFVSAESSCKVSPENDFMIAFL